jgi:hypothetical protein
MKHVHNIKHHKATNNDTEWRGSLYIKTNLLVLAFDRCQNEKVSVSQRQNGLELGPALALELSFPETPETW